LVEDRTTRPDPAQSTKGINMKIQKIPVKSGTAFGGGFYAGRFFVGTQAYALIVAPITCWAQIG
jgi:hypothetical protein